MVADIEETDEPFDIIHEVVDIEEHKKKMEEILKVEKQKEIFNIVMDKLNQQETIRNNHGCTNTLPCKQCDEQIDPLRLFVTGEGIVLYYNYMSKI